VHQFVESVEQIDEMETFADHDVGGIQIGSNSKTNPKSATRNDAAVCAEVAKDANQIFGTTVEKVEHEND